MSRHLLVALHLLSVVPMIARAEVVACPDPEAPAWVEVASPHFLIRTDAGAGVARDTAQHLERLRVATVRSAFGGKLEAPGVTEVVILRDDEEMSDLTGRKESDEMLGGFFQVYLGRSRIVATRKFLPFSPSLHTLQHEMAHQLLAHAFPRQPRWFSEGMAEFLAAVEVNEAGDRPVAVLGKPPPPWKWQEKVSASEVLSWACGGSREVPCYQSAWWLVHYLMNNRADAFADFQRRLARAEDPAAAWKASFPDLDPASAKAMDAFDTVLRDYSRSGKYGVAKVPFDEPKLTLTPRPMACAEVRATYAEMVMNPFQVDPAAGPRRAAAEKAASLKLDPSGLPVWRLLAVDAASPGTFSLATRAVKASPGDWRGWYLVLASAGEAAANQPLRKEAIEKLASAPPDDVLVLSDLTWALLGQGDDGRAVAVAARAVKLAPWEPLVVDAWAVVQASLGQCKEARAAIQRAVDLATGERGGGKAPFLERQQTIEKHCAGTPAPAPSKPSG
jgi:hypothetical protein